VEPTPPTPSTSWIDAEKWKKVRAGMSELEVVSVLGPPTSMREANGARLLFYAYEIQQGSFLSGSVTLRNRVATEIHKPELR
jgi:hypothetical protein